MLDGFNKRTLKDNILAIVYVVLLITTVLFFIENLFVYAFSDDFKETGINYQVGGKEKIVNQFIFSGHKVEYQNGVILFYKTNLPQVTILHDGKKVSFFSDKSTIGEVIKSAGIILQPLDKVVPDLNTPLSLKGTNEISIYRAEEKFVTIRKSIPATHKYVKNPEVEKGKIVIVELGSPGVKEIVIRKLYVEGKLVEEQIVSEKIIKPPQPKVYAEGGAVFRGGYIQEFEMIATAYGPPTVDKHVPSWITKSGKRVRYGLVAVDPKVIPLGSKLYVEGYGYAIAADTGRLIKGNRIDLFFFDSLKNLKSFGRRYVTVYLLELPNK